MKNSITVILQTTSLCNINCGYCYVKLSRKLSHLPDCSIKERDLNTLIQNISNGFSSVKIDWHGGEPLLMGIDFYKTAIAEEKLISKNNKKVFKNSIQTNGTLLSNNFLDFLKANNFSVGISFDGLPETNDKTRTGDSCAFIKEMSLKFKIFDIPFCVLCVTNEHNWQFGKEIFLFLKNLGVNAYSLLPMTEIPGGNIKPTSSQELSTLWKTTFDQWISPENTFSAIDPITTIVQSMISGERPELCSFGASCPSRMVTITPEGYVIPCGAMPFDDFLLGNIFEKPLIEIINSSKARELKRQREESVKNYCFGCEFVPICRGGCREAAFWSSGRYDGQYQYCEARKETFHYIRAKLNSILSTT